MRRPRCRLVAALVGTLLLAAACGTELTRPAPPTILFSQDGAVVRLGDTLRLTARLVDSATGAPLALPIVWASRSPAIVSVDSTGLAVGMSLGQSFVLAKSGGRTDSILLHVAVRFTLVQAGTDASCAVTEAFTAYCWGSNAFGTLGNGTTNDALAPMPVSRALQFQQLQLTAGTVCGVLLGSVARCWGYNGVGQLGDGTTTLFKTLPGELAGNAAVILLFGGAGVTTCGQTTDGQLLCWGWNAYGQLLDGTTFTRRTPILLASPVAFRLISGGGGHICGLDAAGAAWCWGRNDLGQAGDGTTQNRSAPVAVAGGQAFATLAAGVEHTCALTATGEAWCWGSNVLGEIGAAVGSTAPLPTPVGGGYRFTALATAAYHTCGLTGDGTALCWGANGYGQLGGGATSLSEATPVAAGGGLKFASISAGATHTCGIATDSLAYCWGRNRYGGLGNGSLGQSSLPVRVAFQP